MAYAMNSMEMVFSSTTIKILFTLAGIALYNTAELIVLIFVTFKRYGGLYFWSLLLATSGIIPYTLGLLFKFFNVIKIDMLSIVLIDVGWQLMVTGQSIVLYSRLHLVLKNRRILRYVRWMIIANWFISNVPTTICVFGASSSHSIQYASLYAIWERVQLCLYFTQEAVISALYVCYVRKMIENSEENRHSYLSIHSLRTLKSLSVFGQGKDGRSHSQRVLRHLVHVNLLVILLDITLLATEFIGHYEIQVLYKVS
jgi:hypothetical protein